MHVVICCGVHFLPARRETSPLTLLLSLVLYYLPNNFGSTHIMDDAVTPSKPFEINIPHSQNTIVSECSFCNSSCNLIMPTLDSDSTPEAEAYQASLVAEVAQAADPPGEPAAADADTPAASRRKPPSDHAEFVLERIKKEKSLLKFRNPPSAVFKRPGLWSTVYHIDYEQLHIDKDSISKSDLKVFIGLKKILSAMETQFKENQDESYTYMVKHVVICPICFDDPKLTVEQASIYCGKSGNSSNISQHRTRKNHPLTFDAVAPPGTTVTKIAASTKSATPSVQSSISRFANNLPTNRAAAKVEVQISIYRCVNDLGFPASTVQKPVFREMLTKVMQNSGMISKTDLCMSHHVITKMRVEG